MTQPQAPTTSTHPPSHERTTAVPHVCSCHANSDVDGNVPYCPWKYENDEEPCNEQGHLNGSITCSRCDYKGYW